MGVQESDSTAQKSTPTPVAADASTSARPCSEVSAREASYLLALRELERSSSPPTQIALARAQGVSGPAALEMVRRLRTLGLVEPDRLALTVEGTSAALLLASRRHAAHLLTHEVLGLDEADAQPEAERLAPNLSAAITRRLLAGRPERP